MTVKAVCRLQSTIYTYNSLFCWKVYISLCYIHNTIFKCIWLRPDYQLVYSRWMAVRVSLYLNTLDHCSKFERHVESFYDVQFVRTWTLRRHLKSTKTEISLPTSKFKIKTQFKPGQLLGQVPTNQSSWYSPKQFDVLVQNNRRCGTFHKLSSHSCCMEHNTMLAWDLF